MPPYVDQAASASLTLAHGATALRLHATLKALHVHDDAALLAQLARDVHGEAVGVMQRERLLTGKRGALELVEGLGQERAALAKVGARSAPPRTR